MKNRKLLSIAAALALVALRQTPLAAGPALDSLRISAGESAAVQASASGINTPTPSALQKSYGVGYRLKGTFSLRGGTPYLDTPDGRVFRLKLDACRVGPVLYGEEEKWCSAKAFDGTFVEVRAVARQSDDLEMLNVRYMDRYPRAISEPAQADFVPSQRRALITAGKDGVYSVGNTRWLYGDNPVDDQFDWATARVNPELVKNVYFLKKPFAPEKIAGHGMLLFTFKKGGLTDAEGRESSGLVVSVESRQRIGQAYDPVLAGTSDGYEIIWTLNSWEDIVTRAVSLHKSRIIPYQLTLSPLQNKALLIRSLNMAAVNREGEFYNTITNSCCNNLVVLINGVVPEQQRVNMWTVPYLVYNLNAAIPNKVPGTLQEKGLLGPELPTIYASNYREKLNAILQ